MKILLTLTMAVAMMFTANNVFASDYSHYSTEELSKMRGTMQNATAEERESFRTEWQERTRNMTQQERQEYMGMKSGKGAKSGQGTMNKDYGKWDDDNDEYRRGKRSGEESGYGSGKGYGKGRGRN
jgi:hypothetical protein